MKVAHIHIECCRECPYAKDHQWTRRIKLCTEQDDKQVKADEIDGGCPLQDETWGEE